MGTVLHCPQYEENDGIGGVKCPVFRLHLPFLLNLKKSRPSEKINEIFFFGLGCFVIAPF